MEALSCDVVVVGCGGAGLTSALSALESGKSVIVLERAPQEECGGGTRWTEALLRLKDEREPTDDWIPEFSANAGYHVSDDLIGQSAQDYTQWSQTLKTLPYVDPEVLDAFMSGVPKTLEWLSGYGLSVTDGSYPLLFPYPFKQIYGGGLAIVETLQSAIGEKGGQVLYETAGQSLIVEQGRVVGVRANGKGNAAIEIRAQAVVLASGGFQGNQRMLVQYHGPRGRYLKPVAPGSYYNKGEGIRMALDIGACPAGDYAECHRQPIDPRSGASEALINLIPAGILVNRYGRRFTDEASSDFYHLQEGVCQDVNEQPSGIAYAVFDAKIEQFGAWRASVRSEEPLTEDESLEGLAAKIGVPAKELLRTVDTFNRACSGNALDTSWFDGNGTEGIDPPKSNWAQSISEAPFMAYPVVSSVTITFGALKVTRNAEVLNSNGVPIPGLYAAGETVGIYYGNYVGATSVLRALVFGRIAGLEASRRCV